LGFFRHSTRPQWHVAGFQVRAGGGSKIRAGGWTGYNLSPQAAPSCEASERKSRPLKLTLLPHIPATAYSNEKRHERDRIMEIKLAEAIVEACGQHGVSAVLQENYSASWMRGRKTTGVVIVGGDLAQVVTAIIANPHFFIDGELPKFNIKNNLSVSPFRLNLILY
jgi:hypothetical protein